jgi:methanogenic corrinoid protein MtbC1
MPTISATSPATGASDKALDLPALRTAYLDALIAGDATRARHLMDEAVRAGGRVPALYLEVIHPVMEDVGSLWSAGHMNVAQEHYATAITAGVMASLGMAWRRPALSGRLAVVACSPGERHQLGSQMVSDFLEAEGWEVIPLGADTPPSDLAELVAAERPDLVAISTSMREQLPGVSETLGVLGALKPRPFLVVGGRAWFDTSEEQARAMGADARILDPARLVELVRERFPALDAEAA